MPLGPVIETLKSTFGEKVAVNVSLAPMTTFKIGGPAQLLFKPESEADIQALLKIIEGRGIELTVIAGGSNLLVNDGGIRGITVWMTSGFRDITHEVRGEDRLVTCGAAAPTSNVLEYCIRHDIGGFEFAAGIPGTIGGAVKGNAGTKYGAIGDFVESVSMVIENGRLVTLPRNKLEFRYRGLNITGRFIITRVILKLRPGDGSHVREKTEKIIEWRKEKQPWELPSAGSVFINPEEGSAGRMIDQAGCKGWKVGGAMISEKHANFIVNTGNATAADVLELIAKVRRRVFEETGILLESEIQVVGEGK